jgi:hypothetical protein
MNRESKRWGVLLLPTEKRPRTKDDDDDEEDWEMTRMALVQASDPCTQENRSKLRRDSVSNDPRSAPVLRYHGLCIGDDRFGVTLEKSCHRRCRKLGPARQNVH